MFLFAFRIIRLSARKWCAILKSRLITSNNYPECSTALEYRTYCDFEYKIEGTETYIIDGIHKCVKDNSRIIKHPIGTDLFYFIDVSKGIQVKHKVEELPYYLDINNKGYMIDTRTIFHDKAILLVGYNENINLTNPYYSFQRTNTFELKTGESREFDFDNDKAEELEIILNQINTENGEILLTLNNRLKYKLYLFLIIKSLLIIFLILSLTNLLLRHKKTKKEITIKIDKRKILIVINIIWLILALIGLILIILYQIFTWNEY